MNIHQFFDGRYIDLAEIVEIGPISIQGTRDPGDWKLADIRLEFFIRLRGAEPYVLAFGLDDILGKGSIEKERLVHYTELGARFPTTSSNPAADVLLPRAVERLSGHIHRFAEAWIASRSPGANEGAILNLLEAKAARQRAYFDRKQRELPGIEDYTDEDGYLTLPNDIGSLLHGREMHGRFCEAAWWLQTILDLKQQRQAPDPGAPRAAPVAFASEADMDLLSRTPDGLNIDLAPRPLPEAGMEMPLYAQPVEASVDHGFQRIIETFDNDPTAGSFLAEDGEGGFAAGVHRMAREIEVLRNALEPFAEAMVAHGDPRELPDDRSVFQAIMCGHLTIRGVSLGDLRRASALLEKSARKGK
jgi:hypothetical protein